VVSEATLKVDVPGSGPVSAIETVAAADLVGWTFIYAPGAGSSVHDPFGVYACRTLAEHGVRAIRFQFPYQEAGKRSPDRTPVLEATWRAVIEAVRDESRLVIGGRSMGGRIGSMVAAQDGGVDALALFAYPLHPPGKPEQRRVEHLPAIRVPTLFCSGMSDAFGSPEELREAASLVPGSTVRLLEGADHGFAVKKASGRTKEEVWTEAVDAMWEWLRAV
jgi:predicted alpha/beta-hydrolase family hydrolase